MKKKTAPHTGKEANSITDRRTEKDIDELVHSKMEKKPTEKGEEDADDIVHRQYKSVPDENSIADPDDLVHDEPTDDE